MAEQGFEVRRGAEGGLALLERARHGDADAFGALAEEHRASLQRLCYKMTGSHEEAEDLVQDTLLKAYQHIAEFELRSSLSTWLHRIATNSCLDHQRGKKPWDLDKRWEWFRENGELWQQVEQQMFLSPERAAEVKEVAATSFTSAARSGERNICCSTCCHSSPFSRNHCQRFSRSQGFFARWWSRHALTAIRCSHVESEARSSKPARRV